MSQERALTEKSPSHSDTGMDSSYGEDLFLEPPHGQNINDFREYQEGNANNLKTWRHDTRRLRRIRPQGRGRTNHQRNHKKISRREGPALLANLTY